MLVMVSLLFFYLRCLVRCGLVVVFMMLIFVNSCLLMECRFGVVFDRFERLKFLVVNWFVMVSCWGLMGCRIVR